MYFATSLVCVVCLLEIVFYCHGFVRVAKLSTISVELGRSVFVDPVRDLQITFPEGATCRIAVLRSDPLSQRVGFLAPDAFPCDFSLGDVQYSHLGSMFFTQDFVKLQIRVDTENQTRLIPLNLRVTVSLTDMEIVEKNQPITVSEPGGLSSSISSEVLVFKQDQSKVCSVTLLDINNGAIPRYGELVNMNVTKERGNSAQFECSEFLRSNISYQHTKRSSSNKDFIPLVVEMIDQNTDRITREYFQIIVRIMGAGSNQKPVASFQASHTVEVSQYSISPITSDILAASDTETDAGEIIFNITQALQSGQGSLINTDDPYQPLTAFYQRDIEQLKIAYRPPSAQTDQLRMFQVVLEAVDTEGAKSEQIMLLIMVKPTNNNAPVVTKNSGLSLFEGQSRTITDQLNLAIADKDNFNDVRLQVISGLRHGELRIMGHKIDTFMATDLEIPVIAYHHDNSNTYSDNIIFRLTDGEHEVKFLFPITIGPVDDTAPTLVYNTGLILDEGGVALIDQYMLSATDIDSEDNNIQFKVVIIPNFQENAGSMLFSEKKVGVLCLRTRIPPEGDNAWVLQEDGFYEQNVIQFSQYDIQNRRLHYRHLGGEYFHDEIAFILSDQAENPNVSPLKSFRVTVRRIDDLPPALYPGCSMELTADEYGLTEISEDVLHFTDKDSNDDELMFFITKEPYFIDGNPNMTSFTGEILLSDTNVKASKFTQLQVRYKKVAFKSPDLELGTRTRYVQFEFSVSDLSGNTIKKQTFRIVLKPVNNQAPRTVVKPLKVAELSEAILGKEQLQAFDEDTPDSGISFTLVSFPRYGILLKDDQEVQQLNTFSVQDVVTSRMSYRHVVKGEASDEIGLTVDDGVQRTTFLLEIVIVPEKQNVTCYVYNMTVRVKEHSREPIKIHTASQSPRDADIILRIATPPRVGRILRNGKMSYEFSVQDLEAGLIFYEHTGRETGLQGDTDHFNLTLLNETEAWIREGRRYEAVEVVTMILPVDSQPPMVSRIQQLLVAEGGSAKLTSRHLTITDPDTRDEHVTCIIDVQPTVGFLENVTPSPGSEISNKGKRITSFTIDDIRAGHISYVQDLYEGTEPTMDWVAFSCSDGNNSSPRYLLNIDILPQNDEKPQIFTRDFMVNEGDEMIIDVTVLNAVDADEPLDELIFEVVTPPRHGMITDRRKGATTPVYRFPLTQIKKSTSIVYQHDGSESTEDSFALCVSDGKYNTTRTIPIFIIPIDDEEPTLAVNVGMRIEAVGESKIITPRNLKAQDVDSPDDNITFIVRSPPRAGQLRRISFNGSTEILGKRGRFSQKDINERRIVYSQNANIPSERDHIKFDLFDGTNMRLNQDFYVEISVGDRIYPTVLNKGVRLAQNARMVISTNFLSASDTGSPNEKLRYTLIKQPQKGRLEHLDFPGEHLEEFTQLDLAGNKIVYIHTSADEASADSFDFEVSDSTNSVMRTFLVTLLNIDNKKPVLISSELVVNEGENVLITPFELRAEDQDTSPGNLVFTVTRVPLHGWILNGAAPSRVFTQEDINLNRISYAHDGTDVDKDSFEIVVSDGTHNKFYVFPDTNTPVRKGREVHIVVMPVDNRIPQLVLNRGATNLDILPGNRLGFVIRNSALRVEDLDSNNSELLYTITYPPVNGILAVAGRYHGNKSVTNFTQADIDSENITYVLHDGSNTTNDAFDFEVSDPAGNTLQYQRFSLTWAWVSFENQKYEVNETDGVISVDVIRRGFLGEVSFASLSVTGNATNGDDFALLGPTHVQFSPGQNVAELKLRVKDDGKYEGYETVKLELTSPQMCVIREPRSTHVIITDPEDVPSVEVVCSQLVVEENVGEAKIPLRRTGDTSQRLYVTCVTTSNMEEGWATGTMPTSIFSYSDFISRPGNKNSVITFEKEETTKDCPVIIIDDSLYENEETFYVTVLSHLGSRINSERNTSVVVIAPDSRDEPNIFFDPPRYAVDESGRKVDVILRRTGTDLSKSSSVFVRSRQTDPISARASEDYTPVIQLVHFAPYSERQTIEVTIRDDQGLPRVEGTEEFELVLRTPINTGIAEPSKAVIAIDDSVSDLPIVQFVKTSYSTNEKTGAFSAVLMRTGDLTYTSSVRCYTRSMTAQVDKDFKERTDTDVSIIVFNPGENRKSCPVTIVDDLVFERKETFRLQLGSVDKNTRIGERNATVITIVDAEDKPVIRFTKERVFIAGPAVRGAHIEARITVRKTGDPSTRSKVRVYTLDGSAKAGKGYQPMTEILEFSGDDSSHVIAIKILFDARRKIRRAFTVHLSADYTGESELGTRKVIVYIEQPSTNPAVTFPLPPRVVSLRDYDDVIMAESQMIMGYPLICVTACDPKYPRYAETGSICSSQRINNRLTQFRWQIGEEPRDLTSDTFFAKTDQVTLDSIYLVPGSRVRCVARAVSDRGELGLESTSAKVNVSTEEGLCTPRDPHHVGSQEIEASISFTGAMGNKYSNKIHIKVILPHTDGLIPLISTARLTHFKRILRPGVLRLAKHKCSNLLDLNEITTSFGFVTDSVKDRKSMNEGEPYQFSVELRNNKTLRFYRNLDLESCLWTFNSYYDISELTQYCGATVTSDEQSRDIAQSQLTVRVPLYVSYVYRVPKTRGDWVHYDHAMFLRLHLSYDTAVLLNNGVQTPEGGLFNGELWPTAISVRADDKRLVVNFKTKTKFRGTYLIKNPSTEATALVMSRERPHMSFELNMLSSEQSYNYPQQSWQFQSQYALRDYTGVYFIKLIPCTADEGTSYSEPLTCHPRDPVTFTLPIRFQQVPDPVAAQFTLSATFLLMSEREQWLNSDDGKMGDLEVDAAFSRDSKIYGRITLLEGSGLGRGGKGYALAAEKVYLCTGVGEYVPTYDPLKNKFGCMAKSLYLEHRLKVLDKEEPGTVDKQLSDVPFEAKFAEEDINATILSEDPGSDGFVMNSAPLFEVPRSRKWFMHAIYSVTSGSHPRPARSVKSFTADKNKADSKTSLTSHVLSEVDSRLVRRLYRRDVDDKQQIGVSGQGTNIKMIRLLLEPANSPRNTSSRKLEKQTETNGARNTSLVNPLVIGIAGVCVFLLVTLVVVGVLFRRKLLTQQSQNAPPVTNSREVSMTQAEGVAV